MRKIQVRMKEVAGPSSAVLVVTDDAAAVRRFLENARVIRSEKDPMTLPEMKSYVRGRTSSFPRI